MTLNRGHVNAKTDLFQDLDILLSADTNTEAGANLHLDSHVLLNTVYLTGLYKY